MNLRPKRVTRCFGRGKALILTEEHHCQAQGNEEDRLGKAVWGGGFLYFGIEGKSVKW
ncbi:MAG: hypothetical protein KGR16_05640 [Verrucomicrobia bacterium]|nr:hypothetical protein [Verrucomicrobiota bacterium]